MPTKKPVSRRSAPPKTNLGAATALVKRLTEQEVLGPDDVARVQAFLSLAKAVDEHPGNSQMHHEYRISELQLRQSEADATSEADQLLADLSAEVRNP